MTVLEKVKVNKINYEDFIEMVKNDEFKVSQVDFSQLDYEMYVEQNLYPYLKKAANRYNVPSVFNLFETMCAEVGRIINIEEYMVEYMRLVKANFYYGFVSSLSYEEKRLFECTMRYRGASAYRSSLAEVGLKLMLEDILGDEYIIHITEDSDQILGVDIVAEHKYKEEAYYIHITKEGKFSRTKLAEKGEKKIKVFNYNTQQIEEYQRDFTNHIFAFYATLDSCDYINGIYIFRKEYIKELLEANKGLCDKQQLTYLEHVDLEKNVEWVED